MPLTLERSIPKGGISLLSFKNQTDASQNVNKVTRARGVAQGTSLAYFFREPPLDSLPKGVQPGDLLTGTVNYEHNIPSSQNTSKCPGGYPLSYSIADTKVPPPPKDDDKPKEEKNDDEEKKKIEEKSPNTLFEENVRDAKVKYLKTLAGKKDFAEILPSMITEYPAHLPLLLVVLANAVKFASDSKDPKNEDAIELQRKVISAANDVIQSIDKNAVAAELGLNVAKDDPEATKVRKETNEKKNALCEAFVAKASATMELPETEQDEFNSVIKELMQWDDLNADKHWKFQVSRHERAGKLGLALKRIADLLSSDNKKDISRNTLLEKRDEIVEKLGWAHIHDWTVSWACLSKLEKFSPF
jgi:tripeptidyl-peptidase-2